MTMVNEVVPFRFISNMDWVLLTSTFSPSSRTILPAPKTVIPALRFKGDHFK